MSTCMVHPGISECGYAENTVKGFKYVNISIKHY